VPIYRNIKEYPSSTVTRSDMLMIQWDGSIFFANVASFKKRIRKQIGRFLEQNNYPKHWCLVLCFSGVNDIDFTGIEAMESFFKQLNEKENGMTLILCKVKTQVLNSLTVGNIICDDVIPQSHILWELHEAEKWWDNKVKVNKLNTKSEHDNIQLLNNDAMYNNVVHGFTETIHEEEEEEDEEEEEEDYEDYEDEESEEDEEEDEEEEEEEEIVIRQS